MLSGCVIERELELWQYLWDCVRGTRKEGQEDKDVISESVKVLCEQRLSVVLLRIKEKNEIRITILSKQYNGV